MTSRLAVLLVLACAPLAAQLPSSLQRFATGTTGVIVDVVVRDGKGRPVTDLRKEDFELLEDGVRQEIADVTLVAPAATRTAAATSGRPPAASPNSVPAEARSSITTPTFVAFVFDRLSAVSRALAHKGALAYLETFHQDDFAGVFVSDMSLVTLQTFTTDRARLKRAIDEAGRRPSAQFDRDATRGIGPGGFGDDHASVPATAGAESEGRPVDGRLSGPIPTSLSRSIFNTWEALSLERQGYATTDALLALTSAMGVLPGRKAVVFFAEGLRTHSTHAALGAAVRRAGLAGITLNPDGSNQSTLAQHMYIDQLLGSDPRRSLTLLAKDTGGFLADSTNDLARAVRQIDADRRFHYLLTYTPRNDAFNGEWRNVTVNVPRRSVAVRARSGYIAVRTPGTIPLLAYEGPALAALERTPVPRDVPVRAAIHVFPGSPEPRVTLLAAVRGTDLTFARDEQANTYRTDFTLLARIRNAAGDVVRKASQPYRLRGPVPQLEAAQRGDVLFFRQPRLAPGAYTLEIAVHDALTRRAGVHTSTFTIPQPGGLAVSSLIVVQRAEKVSAAEQPADNPLRVGDVLLYPNLGEPVRKQDNAVTLFFVLAGTTGAPGATVEVLREGRSLSTLPLTLDKPDPAGRIRQLAQLPTAVLAPGEYTLRLTIAHGPHRDIREAGFRLVE